MGRWRCEPNKIDRLKIKCLQPEDFVLPLEKELRLKVIDQEIRSCEDLKELQSQLIRVTKLFMTHQHLLRPVS